MMRLYSQAMVQGRARDCPAFSRQKGLLMATAAVTPSPAAPSTLLSFGDEQQ